MDLISRTCHPRRPLVALLAAVALAVIAAGCGESDGSGNSSTTGTLPDPDGGGAAIGDAAGTSGDSGPTFNFDVSGGTSKDAIEPGTFSAPCTTNSDCDSSLCIQTADGKTCSQTCVEDCPHGYICAENKVAGGDTVFMCLPRWLRLCDPCRKNADCNEDGKSGNLCVGFGKPGSFCGVQCELDKDCPIGYECGTVTDATTGKKSNQCVVTAGICKCSQRAVELGLKTSCLNTFQGATCKGERICAAGGLTDCSAEVPKQEECNGIDDDCDGQTDNFTQGGGTCKGKANEFGQCTGSITSCVDGKVECDAPEAKPEKCNGIDDNCDGTTDEGLCDDGDPCTQDKCNTDGSCKHVKLAGMACDDGNVCSQTDKCVAGKCVGANLLDCDDQDACSTDSCDPLTGCKHTPNSAKNCKDDGNVCTLDTCEAGTCVHPPVKEGSPCADDGQVCTLDICQNKQCQHKPANGKKCADDGIDCTNDVCENGKCIHPMGNGLKCEDGNPCTTGDKCLNGKCLAGTLKNCDDGNPCTVEACNPATGGCDKKNNDFAKCTASSKDCPVGVCWGGSCASKAGEACAYEYKPGLCSSKVKMTGTCSASGVCSPNGSPQQTQGCSGNCQGICVQCSIFKICVPF